MTLKTQLRKLAQEKNDPCVTISLNTHRTHPENKRDEISLKNLLKEAEDRVIDEFGKRPVKELLEKMENVTSDIDVNHNLDSLHIFLSNDTKEYVRSIWKSSSPGVHISDNFAVRPLIKNYTRTENYLIMVLAQSGVHLYEAVNDSILKEIKNEDFPFSETHLYNTHSDKSDAKHVDDLVREFLNNLDKALVRVHNDTHLKCIVISTENNFSRLQQVADKPSVYLGHDNINYNQVEQSQIVQQAWKIVREQQEQQKADAIGEMQQAVSQGNVLTDLQEIYQAAIDGRGDMLIVHHSFSQAVLMKDDRTFDLIEDHTIEHAIDDITSIIAWEILEKNGRVVFTSQDEIKNLGDIALKVRY